MQEIEKIELDQAAIGQRLREVRGDSREVHSYAMFTECSYKRGEHYASCQHTPIES